MSRRNMVAAPLRAWAENLHENIVYEHFGGFRMLTRNFKRTLRPLLHGMWTTFQAGKYHGNLADSVFPDNQIDPFSMLRVQAPPNGYFPVGEPPFMGVRDDIKGLEDVIRYIFEPHFVSPNGMAPVVGHFLRLCEHIRSSDFNSFKDMRKAIYLLLVKNFIMFSSTDVIGFFDKVLNLKNMNTHGFDEKFAERLNKGELKSYQAKHWTNLVPEQHTFYKCMVSQTKPNIVRTVVNDCWKRLEMVNSVTTSKFQPWYGLIDFYARVSSRILSYDRNADDDFVLREFLKLFPEFPSECFFHVVVIHSFQPPLPNGKDFYCLINETPKILQE